MAHSLVQNVVGVGTVRRRRWSIDNNCLELYPYIRQNSNIYFDNSLIISNIPLNEWLNLKIEIKSDRYVFAYDGQIREVIVNQLLNKYSDTCQFKRNVAPSLWFGGTSSAPQQVTVDYENFDAFVQYQLQDASQTWTVEYYDRAANRTDGYLATADGSPGDNFPIIAKVGSPKVVLGDVKVVG